MVAMTVAKIFTMLLPIRTVTRRFSGLRLSLKIALLANFPSFFMVLTLVTERLVRAISAPEKMPERKIRKRKQAEAS